MAIDKFGELFDNIDDAEISLKIIGTVMLTMCPSCYYDMSSDVINEDFNSECYNCCEPICSNCAKYYHASITYVCIRCYNE